MSESKGFSRPGVAALFVLLIAIVLVPIVTHPLPPLADYINHVSRAHVIRNLNIDPFFAQFYFADWSILPNIVIDIVLLGLMSVLSVYPAGQAFTAMMFAVTLSGALVMNRALFGGWSAVPLIAAPLLYNEILLVGVMNYLFGVGLSLWALAAWIALRQRPWPVRASISAVFALMLFFCHLYAVGFYGLVLLAFELHRVWSRRMTPRQGVAELFLAGLPFLPILLLLGLSPTWSSVHDVQWTMQGKFDGLRMAINVYHSWIAIVMVAAAAGATGWAWRHRLLRFHPAGWWCLALGTLVYVAMPRTLFASHLADQRLPIALAFALLACVQVDFWQRHARQGFVLLLLAATIMRITEVQLVWDRLARIVEAFHQSVFAIPRGARVLVVFDDRSQLNEINDFELVHAPSLATIERSALVTTTFTVPGKHLLRVRDRFKDYVDTENRWPPTVPYFVEAAETDVPYYYSRWPRRYDYVYILFTKPDAPNPDRKHLIPIADGTYFQLYRVAGSG